MKALRATSVIAATRTDASGRYRLSVAPGSYTIVAANVGGFRSFARQQVTVVAGSTTTVNLVVDSGMR